MIKIAKLLIAGALLIGGTGLVFIGLVIPGIDGLKLMFFGSIVGGFAIHFGDELREE